MNRAGVVLAGCVMFVLLVWFLIGFFMFRGAGVVLVGCLVFVLLIWFGIGFFMFRAVGP